MSEQKIIKRREAFERLNAENFTSSEAVKLIRKSIGKTQVEYAKITNVALKSLRAIEQSKGNPRMDTIEKLLRPFNLKLTVKPRL